jgi:hypothetical protein
MNSSESTGSYSELLRNLSKDYYQNHIGFDEYRLQRKVLLDKIDIEFNGNKSIEISTQEVTIDMADGTVEVTEDTSMYMKTVAFFKNKDVDD